MGQSTPTFKQRVWSTQYADSKFSLFIRERDGKCKKCGRVGPLDCSHFFQRGLKRTRYDKDNCVALCRPCHTFWEKHENNDYKLFMVGWLGQKAYDELETKARTMMKMRNAVLEAMTWL